MNEEHFEIRHNLGNAAVARMLVGNGADVNSANAMGVSALSSAAEFGNARQLNKEKIF